MDPNNFDFNSSDQKIVVDQFFARVINGILYLALKSGKSTPTYLISLPHAKALGRALIKQVEEIEKKTGKTFDIPLSDEPRPSPLKFNNQSEDSSKEKE